MTDGFCTLFDTSFFPQGAAMIESLATFYPKARFFVLAMDEFVASLLTQKFGETVTVISLKEIENNELLQVKGERTRGEYCWTLTPFLPLYVLKNFPEVSSATYVDADVYFFRSPAPMLAELGNSGKSVLITDHGYDPQYDQSATSGRFCVQFVVFKRTEPALKVLNWWKDRCIEWCFARHEDGKFGDQKYLDSWPEMFADDVHIYQEPWNTLAPWNVEWWYSKRKSLLKDGLIFYHFHGLRFYQDRICCFESYKITTRASLALYEKYLRVLAPFLQVMKNSNQVTLSKWASRRGPDLLSRLKNFMKSQQYLIQERIKFADWPS